MSRWYTVLLVTVTLLFAQGCSTVPPPRAASSIPTTSTRAVLVQPSRSGVSRVEVIAGIVIIAGALAVISASIAIEQGFSE